MQHENEKLSILSNSVGTDYDPQNTMKKLTHNIIFQLMA